MVPKESYNLQVNNMLDQPYKIKLRNEEVIMSLKYSGILEKVMIAILFCGLAFGQNSNTTLIGRWANGICEAVDVSGNIAYFGNGGYLEVVDISDPANPIELGKVLTPALVDGIAVSGSYAYSSPVEVGFFDTGGYAFNITVSGSYAYVSLGYYPVGGLRIIDVSTPSSPVEVGFLYTGGQACGIAVSGSYAYVADRDLIRWAMLMALPSAAVTPMWPMIMKDYALLMCPRLPVPLKWASLTQKTMLGTLL
jgi:hypothetical protein